MAESFRSCVYYVHIGLPFIMDSTNLHRFVVVQKLQALLGKEENGGRFICDNGIEISKGHVSLSTEALFWNPQWITKPLDLKKKKRKIA